ncbi:glycosyltransferase [Novipirellula aureliae]|nr:glycosyltransferase [Novipirellula aureliae]
MEDLNEEIVNQLLDLIGVSVLMQTMNRDSTVAMSNQQTLSFTAIVVTFNEERRLKDCLDSLGFCDQRVAVDIGSEDHSVAIAQKCGAECRTHAKVPFGEKVLPAVVPTADHDWILRLDPDEVIPDELAEQIRETVANADSNVASIQLPHHYYFRGKRLHTTRWGKVQYMTRIFHRDRVEWRVHVHSGVVAPKPGYSQIRIAATQTNPVRHYWIDSYRSLFEKHLRYIRHEGEARYARQERFSWTQMLRDVYQALRENLIGTRAIFDGPTPIFLSFFYAWYVKMSHLSLRKYERQVNKGKIGAANRSGVDVDHSSPQA